MVPLFDSLTFPATEFVFGQLSLCNKDIHVGHTCRTEMHRIFYMHKKLVKVKLLFFVDKVPF